MNKRIPKLDAELRERVAAEIRLIRSEVFIAGGEAYKRMLHEGIPVVNPELILTFAYEWRYIDGASALADRILDVIYGDTQEAT